MAKKDTYYTEIVINDGDPLCVQEPDREVRSSYGTLKLDFVVTDDGAYEVHLDTSATNNLGRQKGKKRIQVTDPRHSHRTTDQSHIDQDSYRSGVQQVGRGDVVFVRTTVSHEVYRSSQEGRT